MYKEQVSVAELMYIIEQEGLQSLLAAQVFTNDVNGFYGRHLFYLTRL